MKQYTVAELRQHLAGALDRAERGEAVLVGRRGKRFRLVAESPGRPRGRTKPFFEVTDPQLLEGGWSWEWTTPGKPLRLRVARRPTRRR